MRFLIYPRPVTTYSVGIVLRTFVEEARRRGYQTTWALFNYLGLSVARWDCAFLMGCPRFVARVLRTNRPRVVTMGLPEHRDMYETLGIAYRPEFSQQEERMIETMHSCPKVVFASQFSKTVWQGIFRRRGLPFLDAHKFRVIPHPVDTSYFCPADRAEDGPFTIGCFGTMRRAGRLAAIFEASSMLDFEHRILIVGSLADKCEQEFARAMRDSRTAQRTEYVPWVSHGRLRDYYRRAHCLVHAMHGESFCLVVAEAMACGVPVVVPSYGAPVEFLGIGGGIAIEGKRWLWEEEASVRLANAVCEIRDNYREYADAARKSIVAKVAVGPVVDRYLDFLGLPRCLKGSRPTRQANYGGA